MKKCEWAFIHTFFSFPYVQPRTEGQIDDPTQLRSRQDPDNNQTAIDHHDHSLARTLAGGI